MKVFSISFVIFSLLFGLVYFLAASNGAPGLDDQVLPIEQAALGMVLAITAFSFWITMLIDCLSSDKMNNRAIWGLSLFFFSWVAAILYFFMIYRRQKI